MEFKHFNPIGPVTTQKIIPNFVPEGIDAGSIKKSVPHFEELAVGLGLGAAKGAILKNTFKFFQPNNVTPEHRYNLPQASGQSMTILGYSDFGFPIFSNLVILGDSYKDNSGNVIGQFDTIILDAVIMEIANENNIVSTDIQGRNGTIIEYLSSKSWTINVTGRLLAKKMGIYPIDNSNDDPNKPKGDNLKNLILALNSNKTLKVNSWFLNAAGIYNIVVKKKSFPQEIGSQEYQKFEFEAISDKPVVLKIKK